MIFIVIKLFFVFNIFQLIVATNSESGLLKYKTSIDKIGTDVENFIYDIAKEVAKKADSFINNEYDELTEENPTVENNIIKEEATTSATVNVIEDYTEEERIKRSIDDIQSEGSIIAAGEKPEVHQESNVVDHSVDGLKQELKKLTDLTVMLKEQQNILALLGEKGKFLNDNLQSNPQDMIHLLEQLEDQRRILKPTKENSKELKHLKVDIQEAIEALNKTSKGKDNEKDKELKLELEIKQQKEEIEMLKDLVEQILEKQDSLHKKLKKDKKKNKKVITSNNSTSSEEDKSSEEKRESEDDILGVSLFLQPLGNKTPTRERESNMKENVENKDREQFFNQKNPPGENKDQEKTRTQTTNVDNKATNEKSNVKSIPYGDSKLSLTKSNEKSTHYEEPTLPSGKSEARARSFESDVSQFLDEIDGNKKPDLEEQLKELEEKFIKQSREEKIKRELARLRKLLGKGNEDENTGSKPLAQNEDQIEFLTRLEKLMKSRATDIKQQEKPTDSIREELKKLQIAIANLRPKEDAPKVKEHPKIEPEAKELPDEVKLDHEAVLQLSTHQLRQLRNKIDEILRIQEGSAKHSDIPQISSKALLTPIIDTKKAHIKEDPYPSWYKGYKSEPCPPIFDSPEHSPFSSPLSSRPNELKHMGDNDIPPNFSSDGPSSFLDRSPINKDIRSPYFQNDRSVAEFNYGPEGPDRYIPQQPDYYLPPVNYNGMDVPPYNVPPYNVPPYNEMYYGQSGINRLEQEIQELKALISSANKDKTPKPAYSPEIQSHPKRYKRSLDEPGPVRQDGSPDVSSRSSDVQLFDDVTSKLREYFLEEDSKGRTAADTRQTGFNEITDRLNHLKSQRRCASTK
uniref:Interaptin-like isoform X3 n=1 Tax=Diabrotica virgifera virgifera TaxID=50390 RepID=A0A6P7F8J9_DIAVI